MPARPAPDESWIELTSVCVLAVQTIVDLFGLLPLKVVAALHVGVRAEVDRTEVERTRGAGDRDRVVDAARPVADRDRYLVVPGSASGRWHHRLVHAEQKLLAFIAAGR